MEKELEEMKKEIAKLKTRVFDLELKKEFIEHRIKCNEQKINILKDLRESEEKVLNELILGVKGRGI